jgi:hypothetical protein
MHVKQLPRWAAKKRSRQPGQHLMRMRKLFGPTNPHAKYDRALFNKGNPPPKGLMYWIWNRGGEAREQRLIAHIVEDRLCRSKE